MALKGKVPEVLNEPRFKALFYGNHGVGKSHVMCSIKDAYVIDTENLGEYPDFMEMLKNNNSAYAAVSDLSEIVDEIKELMSTPNHYKTVIIDSLTPPYLMAVGMEAERLSNKEKNTEGTEFGKNTAKPKRALASLALLLSRIDMNVIVTAHEKALYEGGEEIGKIYDIPDKMGYMLGAVFHLTLAGKNRKARVIKSRYGKQFPINDFLDFNDGYGEICKRMGVKTFERDAVTEPLASESQMSEFAQLCNILSVPEESINKWLSKGKASNLSELSAKNLSALINSLKDRINQPQGKTL